MNKRVLCFDFGASGGRAVLSEFDIAKKIITAKEIHRFKNRGISVNGTLYWDILALFSEVRTGLVKAHKAGGFSSIGIDTWGVDYGIIDKNGFLIGNPVQYRDNRTDGMVDHAKTLIDTSRLYALTGTQIMEINTAFQLLAEKRFRPYILENGGAMLNIPDLLAFMLTGEISSEISIASTTQLLDPAALDWSDEAVSALGIPRNLLRNIVKTGDSKGFLSQELCDELNIPTAEVVAVCGHDTQCAFYGAPFHDDHIIISTGTWSLVGTTLSSPVTTPEAARLNLTNEVGTDGTIDLLKNITGLWLIQETKAFLESRGDEYSFAELEALARECPDFEAYFDPDAPEFSTAGDMPSRIRNYCQRTGQAVPQTLGEIMRTIYLSLAMKFRYAVEQIKQLTNTENKQYEIFMVGGGIKAEMLCRLTADVCGCTVYTGPVEATVTGNALIQLIRNGSIPDRSMRAEILENTCTARNERKIFTPSRNYDTEYEKFKNIIESPKGV